MIKLTIITPTTGRPTLSRSIESMIAAGLSKTDEVLVVGDGPQPEGRRVATKYQDLGHPVKYLETEPNHYAGERQRNFAMPLARGTHILFLDDDDAYRPGALDLVRKTAAANPMKILMFRMESKNPVRHSWAPIRWIDYKDPFIGNIGTPMFVVPNKPTLLGVWKGRENNQGGCDFNFMESTLAKWPTGKAAIVWREEVIVDVY